MNTRRVVITGMGIVSPVGSGLEYAWSAIKAGKSGIRKITEFQVDDLASQVGGTIISGTEAGEYNQDALLDPALSRKMDKCVAYGVACASEAIKDAGLENLTDEQKDRTGVLIGAGIGGLQTIYENCVALENNGPRRVSPFFMPKALINMMSGQVSIIHGFRGPNMSIVTACATGTHSIGDAARMIMHGDADVMVAGGSEAGVCRIGVAGFGVMHALATKYNEEPEKASRPWDKNRCGFVIAEGAGIMVLEEYEHAKARGAKIYGEILGYGMSGDAHHITAPAEDGNGGRRAMEAALRDANLKPSDIGYINAHGTSTPLGDLAELSAVKTLFAGTDVSMSSTKSMTGHLLGAAGAIEAIFSTLALRDQICPPTINLDEPAEETEGVDLVPHKAKAKTMRYALSNSFGFGGTNASIIIG
ncbi:MAG: beta-ketoacyl-ACP synthase II, partial [Rickettsiales bacterium]|nr:beta-ketoacyl-ACP synthase II [Rickettsiales bacterium]